MNIYIEALLSIKYDLIDRLADKSGRSLDGIITSLEAVRFSAEITYLQRKIEESINHE